MHDLKLVGFTTDRRGLIFRTAASAPGDSFVVPLTEQLVAVVAELAAEAIDPPMESGDPVGPIDAVPDPPSVRARPRSLLSVRDIQARLRAGEPVAQVAREADVEEDWIERFAPPIRAEQRRIVERALAARQQRPRGPASAAPLRRAVGLAMADRGVAFTSAAFEAAWTARLLGQDRWAVDFSYRHRGPKTARWVYDAATDELTAGDRTAAQLGHVTDDPRRSVGGDAVDGIVGDPNASSPITTEAETPSGRTGRRASGSRAGATKTVAEGSKTVGAKKGRAAKKAASATRKKRAAKKAASETTKGRATKKAASAAKKAPSATRKGRAAKKAPSGPKVATGRSTTKAAATKAAGGGPKPPAGSRRASAKRAPGQGSPTKRAVTKRAATKRAAPERATHRSGEASAAERATKPAVTKQPTTERAATERAVPSAEAKVASGRAGRAPALPPRPPVPRPSANGGAHLARPDGATRRPEPPTARSRPTEGPNGAAPSRPTVAAAAPAPRRTQPTPPADGRPVATRPGAVDLDAVPLAPAPPPGAAPSLEQPPDGSDTTGPDRPGAMPEGVDRAGARRARAAERSAATVQFRSGSAVPVRASTDRTTGPAARGRRQLRGR